ncbi:alpha,alpha-trehalase TreA [Dyadobacter chenwenxiniae]|uniref:Alpha,alpha-trehalase TreA n=1 Tax=Dyadobacter chenwenxiniae TaxID=2906456 RepID=A0A9X1PTZ3_9BACT|nr:alpha,alpha-trehalase TreA [Dyadobacter chenwenxiniae]MCF0065046.1 alpha,alpha-trehalase TreA [Dyadobacter chenwenxiniae]UON83161.1 alpha,alpha-trehalase TreA [Dyadobacter chenwenxiniae]
MYGFIAPTFTYGQSHVSPDDLYGTLFRDIQHSHIFKDSKTFADAIPLEDPVLIIERYHHEKGEPDFDLQTFVSANFRMPVHIKSTFKADKSLSTSEHIKRLWPVLTRQPENQERGGSLIPLPFPYVVPGGRFREIYYWDSYFTMLGLKESGRTDLIESMVNNFAYLIDSFGYIPTANRTYYLTRSQPPFFSLMVRLYSDMAGKKILKRYLPQLQKEYDYWMQSDGPAHEPFTAHRRLVKLPDGVLLNRYWDDKATPRPESYREDVELSVEAAERFQTEPDAVFRHIRAAAESGWDFSSRWFADENDFASIHTTDILPVDLNCLMHHLEKTLAEAYLLNDNSGMHLIYEEKARLRSAAIQTYFWDESRNYFMDYDFKKQTFTKALTLAGTFPLYFKLATKSQSHYLRGYIRLNFMRSGGLLTTTVKTGQQWDAPNGWAPLQWITYKGLRNYNFHRTANELCAEWITLVDKEFKHSGKMLEKYNVSDTNLIAGGGEYEIQEGFGWTNGVYLRMKNKRS